MVFDLATQKYVKHPMLLFRPFFSQSERQRDSKKSFLLFEDFLVVLDRDKVLSMDGGSAVAFGRSRVNIPRRRYGAM